MGALFNFELARLSGENRFFCSADPIPQSFKFITQRKLTDWLMAAINHSAQTAPLFLIKHPLKSRVLRQTRADVALVCELFQFSDDPIILSSVKKGYSAIMTAGFCVQPSPSKRVFAPRNAPSSDRDNAPSPLRSDLSRDRSLGLHLNDYAWNGSRPHT